MVESVYFPGKAAVFQNPCKLRNRKQRLKRDFEVLTLCKTELCNDEREPTTLALFPKFRMTTVNSARVLRTLRTATVDKEHLIQQFLKRSH